MRGDKLPGEVFTRGEVRAILDACSLTASTGVRNRALLTVLYRTGLRVSEALALGPADLDSQAATIRVRCGKGGRERTVAMDAGGWDVLARWMDRRKLLGLSGHRLLFCTLAGERLATRYVRALLRRLAAKAGIAKRVHAHGFRHTHAVELCEEGTDVRIISRQLGHRSLTTTVRYLDHLRPADVIRAIQKRTWSDGRE